MLPVTMERTQSQLQTNEFIRSVYNWMAGGLALTGLAAYYVTSNESFFRLIFGNRLLFFGLVLAEIILVFSLIARVGKMQASTATGMFLLYSALNGLTLSSIFMIYTRSTVASAFFISAATFVTCSVYGMITKKDLTSLGSFMAMGLFGIVIASVVNLFVRSSGMSLVISYIGVFVFIGLTAYDTQKLKIMARTQPAGIEADVVRKGAVMGALTLYLDFINLFLMMLRIFGSTRE
ncbi:MAG: Bax inhibitor-1/YccA family protein [Thermodesulfobacteriota bacterium]